MMSKQTGTDTYKYIFFVVLLLSFIWFAVQIVWVLKLLLISLLIVYALHPAMEWAETRLRLAHAPAVGLTFLVFLLLVVTLVSLVVPVVHKEIQEIIADIPYYSKQFQRYIEEFTDYLEAFGLEKEHLESIIHFPSNIPRLVNEVASFSLSMVSSVVDIFLILFIVLYLLYDFRHVRATLVGLVPAVNRNHIEIIMGIVDRNFGGFIRGNILRCTLVGLLTGIILAFFGVPYALLLGVLAGVLNIILYIGPYIAAIPALLLSFSPYTPSPFVVVIIYVFVQALDGIVLSPLLLGRATKLRPITVIAGMLIGQQVAGILGMIISTPLAGIVKGLLEHFRDGRQKAGPS